MTRSDPRRAIVIDLGYAITLIGSTGGKLEDADKIPRHHHITVRVIFFVCNSGPSLTDISDRTQGTLPFMAKDIIRDHVRDQLYTVSPAIHHDLESLFWVLVYFTHKYCDVELPSIQTAFVKAEAQGIPSNDKSVLRRMAGVLEWFECSNWRLVEFGKLGYFDDGVQLAGTYRPLQKFLQRYLRLCKRSLDNNQDEDLDEFRTTFDHVQKIVAEAITEEEARLSKDRASAHVGTSDGSDAQPAAADDSDKDSIATVPD